MLITVYSHASDLVTKAMIQLQKEFPHEVVLLPVEEILNQVEISDEIVNGEARIGWKLSSGLTLTNELNHFLVNRVISLEEKMFENFHPDDRSYAFQEFYAYLEFALQAFPKKSDQPGPYGLGGNQLPLPIQWEKIREMGKVVPGYFFGSDQNYSPEHFLNPIRGSFYSYYQWKPNHGSQEFNSASPGLVYERPKGDPFLVLCLGEATRVIALNHPTTAVLPGLDQYALECTKTLNLKFAEVLLFVDPADASVRFGMASPLFLGASHSNEIVGWAKNAILEQCKLQAAV